MAHADRQASDKIGATGDYCRCIVCQDSTVVRHYLPHVWHQPVDSQPYTIRWCANCDFGQLHPRPDPEQHDRLLGELRQRQAAQPPHIPSHSPLPEKIRVHLAWRVSHANHRQISTTRIHELAGHGPLDICVLGDGNHELVSELKNHGHHVTCPAFAWNKGGQERSRELATFPVNVDQFPDDLASKRFDFVIMPQFLHLCPDPAGMLQFALRLLKPGGHLLADVPNNECHTARRRGPAWYFCGAGSSLNFFTRRSLSKIAKSAGFEIVDLFFGNYTVQFRQPRLDVEREIWDRLYAFQGPNPTRRPPRNSSWELWRVLACSMFREPAGMYEILGIVARKSTE